VHQSDERSGDASAADEPEAVTSKVTIKKKFVLALIAYAVLGVLAWTTLSDEPIRVFNANVRLRTGTLLILGLFAFRAALYFWRTRIEEERADVKPTD
jgi:asparagine N-glycosylation enzyme membrane subunit Stt3